MPAEGARRPAGVTREPDGPVPARLRAILRALAGDPRRRRKATAALGLDGGRRAALAEGPHLLAEALAAGVPVHLVVATGRGLEAGGGAEERLARAGTPVYRVGEGEFTRLAATRTPQGVLAVVELAAPAGAAALTRVWRGRAGMALALCGVQDPGNVGSLARSARAAGVAALCLDGRAARDDDPKSLRASQGALLHMPVARLEAAEAIAAARAAGARVAAAVPRGGAAPWRADLSGPLLLLLGSEGEGLDEALAAQADVRLTLPMAAGESLGVAAAGAALLYERVRQLGA